jgi:hypothetical protein
MFRRSHTIIRERITRGAEVTVYRNFSEYHHQGAHYSWCLSYSLLKLQRVSSSGSALLVVLKLQFTETSASIIIRERITRGAKVTVYRNFSEYHHQEVHYSWC